MMRDGRRASHRVRRILIVLALAAAALLCFAVEYCGGQGGIPTWETLYAKAGLSEPSARPAQGTTSVTFLDVGQGDSVLILHNGSACLIDAGPYEVQDTLPDDLRTLGVEKIELLVMTHPHADHIGGMPAILEEFEVKTLLLPVLDEEDSQTGLLARTLDTAREQGTELISAQDDMELSLGSGTITVLSTGLLPEDGDSSELGNNGSLCLRFSAGNFSFLDTGDAEKDSEADLLVRYGRELRSTVFKAGHHGSSTSNTEDFLRAVSPELVVASCGLNNDYGHPHHEVVQRLENLGIPLCRTDLDGSVTVTATENGFVVSAARANEETLAPAA